MPPIIKNCGNPSACPERSQLPLGTLAPNNSNQCRALRQAQLVNTLPGSIVNTNGTTMVSGTYIVPSNLYFKAPAVLATILFCPPFKDVPFVNITIDDYGNSPAWVLHVRNVTKSSFDVVLKNADKLAGVSFGILWNAVGV